MGKRQQRRAAEMANQASALAEEAMVVWRVMSWYRKGAEPVFGAPLRCPECGAFCLVLRVDGREGRARNRCSECDHEFYVTERAIEAVLSGRMARPSGLVLPGELARNATAAQAHQQQPVVPTEWSSPGPSEIPPPGYPAPVHHAYPPPQHGYPPQHSYPPGQYNYPQPNYGGPPGAPPQHYPSPPGGYPQPTHAPDGVPQGGPHHTYGGPRGGPQHTYPPPPPGHDNDNGQYTYPPPQPGYPPAAHHYPPPPGYHNDNGQHTYPPSQPGYPPAAHHHPPPPGDHVPPTHAPDGVPQGLPQHTYGGPRGDLQRTYPPPPPGYDNDNGQHTYPPLRPGDAHAQPVPEGRGTQPSEPPPDPSIAGSGAFRRPSPAAASGSDIDPGLDEQLSSFVSDRAEQPNDDRVPPPDPPLVLPALDRRQPSKGEVAAPADAPEGARRTTTDVTHQRRRKVAEERRGNATPDASPESRPAVPVQAVAGSVSGPGIFGPVLVTDADGRSRSVDPGPPPSVQSLVDQTPTTHGGDPSLAPNTDSGDGSPPAHSEGPAPGTVVAEPPPSAAEPDRPRSSLFHVPKPTVEVPLDNGDDSPLRILLVEDDPGDAALIQSLLTTAGPDRVELRVASSRRDGQEIASEYQPDVVLLDLDLPDSHGLATITRWCFSDTPGAVIVMSGDWSEQVEARGREQGVADFVSKERMIKMLDDGPAGTESMLELLRTIRATA